MEVDKWLVIVMKNSALSNTVKLATKCKVSKVYNL